MQEILAVNAAIALIEKLIPLIAERVKAGEVSVEEQAQMRARYEALRAKGDEAFAGSHWKVKPGE